MNAPPLLQPPPPAGTLDRFATASTGLLGIDGASTLRGHLRALADLAGIDLVLLYHDGLGAGEFELVASFGLPPTSAGAFDRVAFGDAADAAVATSAGPRSAADALAIGMTRLGIRGRHDVPLWADGGCIGHIVFGSRRWNVYDAEMLHVFAAAGAQIAVVLRRRLAEEGDAKAASSPDAAGAAATEPLLFRRRRDRFVALLAHELRNPVAPIRSGLELLATDRLDPAARQGTVRMMQRQLVQLAHLIDDFLDSARLNTGRLKAERRPVPLLPALVTALESVEPAMRIRGQRIERVGWETAPVVVVDADPVRLVQAFANLLATGAAATPTGGTLVVRLGLVDGSATIAFEDRGPPFADGDHRHGPDAVGTAAATVAEPGGAPALVDGLLALNDGYLVARDREGGGGRVFTVTLPVTAQSVPSSVKTPEAAAPNGHRILVVDDNRDAAESLGMLFRLDGHEVLLAHDGPGAVVAASEFKPEIIVMDLGLPVFSGYEAIMRIRSAPGSPRPGIVALTGWGTRADRDASARAGADLHLVKPVGQAELSRAIRALLEPAEPVVPAP